MQNGIAKKVKIYDTTLRDGTQGEGISFSAKDKVLLARQMDEFGIDYIEGGWPGSNPRDMEFFKLVKNEQFRQAKLTAFGSTRRAGIQASEDEQLQTLLDADTPVITIFGKSWLLHVKDVLRTTPEENLLMIKESVSFLKNHGKEVVYDAEHFFDGYKDDHEYALATVEAAVNGGADYIVLCDTNGGSQIEETRQIVEEVKKRFPETEIGIHCHNDCGLGVALSLTGIEAGATMVQGTMNGFGERIGNANLTTIIPNLGIKLKYNLTCGKNIKNLKEFSVYVDKMANMVPSKKEPFVGVSAFAHKGGVHANAAKKVARSYEHIEPELVGNRQRILLSDMSGRSSVLMKAKEMGIHLNAKSSEITSFLKRLKKLENQGHEFENADASFYVLLHKHFLGYKDSFKLVSYRTISEVVRDTATNISEAVIKLQVDGEEDIQISVSESTGPVGALDHAARQAFGTHFQELKTVQLIDYKVRILQTGLGVDSITQVLMKSTDGAETWWTSGASPSIIEASWEALRDSFRYKLLRSRYTA
jgi:2-isopropylmalate synthase